MAMLLAMYQKMRLIREKNQATLDLTRFSSKYDRVSKNIERVQKMYTSKIASLEKQGNMMQSQAKVFFQQAAGLSLGTGSAYLNPTSMYGATNAFTAQFIQNCLRNGIKAEYDSSTGQVKDSENLFKNFTKGTELYQMYMQQGGLPAPQEIENDTNNCKLKGFNGVELTVPKQEYALFNAIIAQAQNQYYQRSSWMQQADSNFNTNVSIWLEAAKAELEAEQDAAVEPLAYQQTMWELEKTQTEAKLERIKADLESYDRLLGDETKGHAPRFGLG